MLVTVMIVAAGVAGTRFVPPVEVAHLDLIALAFAGCLGLLVLGALLPGGGDRRVRSPDHVRDELGLTLLGTVPRVSVGDPQSGMQDGAEIGEAFRTVRRNLMHVHGKAEPAIVAVTSLAPAEGKSFVSARLAREFSGLGRRTLVIDADVGRQTGQRLNGGRRVPGLTEYLAGRANLEQVIQPASQGAFDRIACGAPVANASKLLQSSAMAGLLGELRSSYDVILIKTSPLNADPDPVALATLAGNVVIVLRAGTSDRRLAMAQLERLDRSPINLLGGVLNDVPQNGTCKPQRRHTPENDAWDREQIKAWQHVQGAEAAAENRAGAELPRPGKVYQPNGDPQPNGCSGQADAQPVADEAAEEAATVEPVEARAEPAAPAVPLELASPVEVGEPVVPQPGAAKDAPAPGAEADNIWYEPEWDLWYNPDWEVRAATEMREDLANRVRAKTNGGHTAAEPEESAPPPEGDLPFSLDAVILESETSGGNGGNGGKGEPDPAQNRGRAEDRRLAQQRLRERRSSEDMRPNGGRRLNGYEKGNGGRHEERLDAFAAAQVEKFREHQRRHHQRLWK